MGPGASQGEGVTALLDGCHADVIALADTAEQERAVRVVGKPTELTAAAKLDALPAFARWKDGLLSRLEAGGEAALLEWQRSVAEDPEVAAALYRTRLQADMGGQLFVRAIEVPETLPRALAVEDARPSFLRLPFREALESFLGKRIVTREAFEAMDEIARRDAFSATGLASEQLVARARELLRRHLSEGGSVTSFIAGMRDGSLRLGVEAASPSYLENVMRTNTQSAYGAGRLRQLGHPAVVAARPFVEYRTAGDSRVRGSHAALNGVIFDRTNDDGWQRFAPPLDYQCRCAVRALRTSQVDRSRVVHSRDLPTDAINVRFAGPGQ